MSDLQDSDWVVCAEQSLGHRLRRDSDGRVDHFVVDDDHHNGPGCALCGLSWCEHCTPASALPACDGGAALRAAALAAEDAARSARLELVLLLSGLLGTPQDEVIVALDRIPREAVLAAYAEPYDGFGPDPGRILDVESGDSPRPHEYYPTITEVFADAVADYGGVYGLASVRVVLDRLDECLSEGDVSFEDLLALEVWMGALSDADRNVVAGYSSLEDRRELLASAPPLGGAPAHVWFDRTYDRCAGMSS